MASLSSMVWLALTITFASIMVVSIIVIVVILCAYRKPIREFKNVEFDNAKHEAEKLETPKKSEEESETLPEIKSFKD